MLNFDVAIIGGGPAGMAAALSVYETGASVVIVDKDKQLGGILNQCVHQGFGQQYFGKEVVGTEYARIFAEKINASKVEVLLNSFVTEVSKEKVLTVCSQEKGMVLISAKAIVFAMGCRERTAGTLGLAGERPVGVWTAGTAKKLAINGIKVGNEVVILGSGDIGLIAARRMTHEGAKVKMVCEIMPRTNALERNIKDCLTDLNIPLRLSTTVTRVEGKKRVTGVYISKVDKDLKPVEGTDELIPCDCLLLSVGLIPENELCRPLGLDTSGVTGGAIVDEYRQTSVGGFFSCGNSLHVHDLVDNVSFEAHIAGYSAGLYALDRLSKGKTVSVKAGSGIRYVLPQKLHKGSGEATLHFRTTDVFKNVRIVAECNGQELASVLMESASPGKLGGLRINKQKISGEITLCVKEQ